MRITLLNPPFKGRFSRASRSPAVAKSGTLYFPIWLAYATGVLEKAGFQVQLIDSPARGYSPDETISLVKGFNPHLVVVDTTTPSIHSDLATSGAIKSTLPEAHLCLVGTHASVLPEEVLSECPSADSVARKEYDYTLQELAQNLAGGVGVDGVAGISFRREEKIIHNPDRKMIDDLDALPLVAEVYRRHLVVEDYFFAAARYPMSMMITGRGCPHRCIFCLYPQTFHGRRYRLRSAENVAEEFAYTAKELPQVREVVIEDDTFSANRERMRSIARLLIDAGNRLPWSANVRVNLDFETMVLLRACGCRLLIVGYEAGDSQILRNMHKGITLEQMEEFARSARRAGLLVHGCFMAGNPGEDRRTLSATLRLALKLSPDTAQFFPVMAYPGTEAYRWAEERGYLLADDFAQWCTPQGLHSTIIRTEHLTPDELVRFCDYARRIYYLRPRYWAYKLWQSLSRAEERRRNLKALRTFLRHLF